MSSSETQPSPGEDLDAPQVALPSMLTRVTTPPRAVPIRSNVPSEEEVVRVAQHLFERWDPTMPDRALIPRQIRSYYASDIRNTLDFRLKATVHSRGRLYVQGECLGVGATVMMADYVRAFNYYMESEGFPDRMCRIELTRGLNTEAKLLDALCRAMASPPTHSELKLRSPASIGDRFMEAIRN